MTYKTDAVAIGDQMRIVEAEVKTLHKMLWRASVKHRDLLSFDNTDYQALSGGDDKDDPPPPPNT